jgi:hypothetical protein
MNCANHPSVPAVAFCRTCGKPLCATCKRDVMGVIYCEQCLAERLGDVHPATPPIAPGFVPSGTPVTVVTGPGPHPALAGILAGFFPFGVGAVYTGQYAKGLAHLLIFTGFIWGLSSGHFGSFEPVLGIGLAFFMVYQIVDSVRSANAIRAGLQPPDPFGFNRTFGMIDRPATVINPSVNSSAAPAIQPVVDETPVGRVPTAAVVLIGLGVLFLLQTVGIFEFNVERIWPMFLIGLGVWLFISRTGMVGGHRPYTSPTVYNKRVWSGPIWLITIGGLFLIQSFGGPGFGRTWPVLLLVVGLMKLMENRTAELPPPPSPPAVGFQPAYTPPTDTPSASTEVKNG